MNLKKSLENRIRGWFPEQPKLPKAPAKIDFQPLKPRPGMERSYALGLAGGILAVLIVAWQLFLGLAFSGALKSLNTYATGDLFSQQIAIQYFVFAGVGFAAAILAFVGVSIRNRRGGILLLIGGVMTIIASDFLGILPCILMVVSGVIELGKPPMSAKQQARPNLERTVNPEQAQASFLAVSESKIKENTWFLMGMGYVAIISGLLTAVFMYFLYDQERLLLSFGKIPADNPVFGTLPGLIAGCLIVAAGGGVAGLLGYSIDKKQNIKEFFYREKPDRDKGNKLFKVGVTLIWYSLFILTMYLISAFTFWLWFTAISTSVGIAALILGISILKHRMKA